MTNPTLIPEDEPNAGEAGNSCGLAAGAAGSASASWSPQPQPNIKVISAGGLVFRQSDALIETLLCGKARPGNLGEAAPLTWRLPKGTPEYGETVAETARREVQEETGVRVNVLAPITSIRYFFVGRDDGVRYDKTVYFYLMEPLGGSTSDHDAEFDVVEWHSYEQALELLDYDNERSVLEKARAIIATYREGGGL